MGETVNVNRSHKRKSLNTPRVVVAGDVCIDWLSIPVESLVPGQDSSPPMNWQLRDGRHMYAEPGGAWLTAAFTEAAVGKAAKVVKPEEEPHLENVPPEKIIHSMLMLGGRDRERDHEKVPHWAVTHFDGYAGPAYPNKPEVKSVTHDNKNAQIVLLDDAGNGFRNNVSAWPKALSKECKPLVLYKVRRPLGQGALWDRLKAFHLDRTIALLGANELRGEGGSISRGLSWERTATDLILSLMQEPRFEGLRRCLFLIVTFGIEGAVLVQCADNQVSSAHLWYLPNLTESEMLSTGCGDMSGFGSAFAAAIISALVKSRSRAGEFKKIDNALRTGIRRGLSVMHGLLEEAFGPCNMKDPRDKSRTITRPPKYPVTKIFKSRTGDTSAIFDIPLPKLPNLHSAKEMLKFRGWRILESRSNRVFVDLAADVAYRGPEKVFEGVPIGKFEKLVTLERLEIESYRSIRNLIREFLNNPRPERPLSLAVFGAPGSGKSFGVTQVARDLDKEGNIEKLDFNVSQWNSPDYLVNALHRVRDHAIKGKVPLVFFDEFDSRFGTRLGWLKYFLAPMQDGVFADGLFTHDIGKAIFVFAGGTADTYAEFAAGAARQDARVTTPTEVADQIANLELARGQAAKGIEQGVAGVAVELQRNITAKDSAAQILSNNGASEKEDSKSVKLPDFVSRLRGHVDVFGLDPPFNTNLLRRALILRSNILKKFPSLVDGSSTLRINEGVLRAFLQVPEYSHGARSLEAILDMSQLVGKQEFDPSRLPPLRNLNLHVDGDAFTALVQHHEKLGAKLEKIAQEIHARYLKEELGKKDKRGHVVKIGDWDSLRYWEKLDDRFKKSNREQAASYPILLAAVGCNFEEGAPDKSFSFSDNEIKILAQMEHDRWLQERRLLQPSHPDLVPWSKLPQEEQDKDIRTIKAIPEILGTVGLKVIRLA